MPETPLIEVTKLGFANGNRVFAKCENHNPVSKSHYDRVYEYLFDKFIEEKKIVPGKTYLIESSSGNAGTSFARYCKIYGFNGAIIFPKNVRSSRIEATKGHGVDIIISRYDNYMLGARKEMLKLLFYKRKNVDAQLLNHSQLWDSVVAMKSCGREIIDQFGRLNLTPNFFISALGNGTSTTGIGMPIKNHFPECKIIGFEPNIAPVYTTGTEKRAKYKTSTLTGTGVWGIHFPNMKKRLLNKIALIKENKKTSKEIKGMIERTSILFNESIGISSAASLLIARKIAERCSNRNILIVFYDISEYYDDI